MKSLSFLNLAAGLIAFVMVLARLVPRWAQESYHPQAAMQNWSTLTLQDPKVGSMLRSVRKDGMAHIMLAVTDCGECNASKVAAFSGIDLGKQMEKVVLVSESISLDEAMRRFGHFDNIRFEIMSDGEKQELNTSFLPRVYFTDSQDRLQLIQPPAFSYGQAFWQIKRMVNR